MDLKQLAMPGLLIGLCTGSPLSASSNITLKIQGSSTVNPIVAEAAEKFRMKQGWRIFVDTQGGSSGGISAVAEGLADLGMSSKPVGERDRRKYPHIDFNPIVIGLDGVALVVSLPVWISGVHALSKNQIQKIYERKIQRWTGVNGPNTPIVFYNKEPGRGTWSVFADWVYNGHENAPLVNHPEVGSNEETRNKVSFHPSAISQLSIAWAENSEKVRALGIKTETGDIIYPNSAAILEGDYPLRRSLFVITTGRPAGPLKIFIDYLLSEAGQMLVRKHGYLPVR